MARVPTLALFLALVLPAAAPLVPVAQGSASAGVEVVSDAAGDHASGSGLAADLLRLGATTDASNVQIHLKVADRSDRPVTLRYRVGFTVQGDLSYYATVSYSTGGALSGATLWRAVHDGARVQGNPIAVAWSGNELRFEIPRGLLGSPADGTLLVNVDGAATSMPPAGSELSGTYALHDGTGKGTYVVGANPDPTPPSVPTAPLDLAAAPDYGRVTLSWSAPASEGTSPIQSYNVYRGTTSEGKALLANLPASPRTYVDNAVAHGTTYFYEVSAANAVGEGPRSIEVSATTPVPTVPSAPRNLQATAGPEKITLSWNTPSSNGGSPVTGYRVYRGPEGAPLDLLAAVPASPRSYVDSDVVVGATYVYALTAVNANGEGPASAEASAAPLPLSAPGAPRNVAAQAGNRTVTL
ncbi:MAG TPA: fibronectin type III domain-containing protein, partial [Candidatus Thermoplasmatota archaeon]|nr:fibronectin type III domain-containing protein [Candidatus Thermoplasmatota archaeon]